MLAWFQEHEPKGEIVIVVGGLAPVRHAEHRNKYKLEEKDRGEEEGCGA